MKSKIVKSIKVGAVLFLGVGLLMGCLGSSPEPAKVAPTSNFTAVDSHSNNAQSTDLPVANVTVVENIKDADSKNSQEKVQESVQMAIADGTYAENVFYQSPGGRDMIEISISVKGDVVTAMDITAKDVDGTSQGYINKAKSGLPNLVIGKKITELNIPKNVAGSSLTVAAFKAQIEKLIAEN